MFGLTEEEDYNDLSHDRSHSEDFLKVQNFGRSQNIIETSQLGISHPKGKLSLSPPSNGPHAMIRRLRSLSFSRKSPPPLEPPTPALISSQPSLSPNVILENLNSVRIHQNGKRGRSLSFNKKPDNLHPKSPEFQPQFNIKRFSLTQSILKNMISNQENEPTSPIMPNYCHIGGYIPKSPKRTRRMSIAGFFTGNNKDKSKFTSHRLYPHLETDRDYEPKYSIEDTKFNNNSLDGSQRKQIEVTYPEDIIYSSEDESDSSDTISRIEEIEIPSGDNVSVKTITRESIMTQNDNSIHSNFEIIKDTDINKDATSDSPQSSTTTTDRWSSTNKLSDTGSVGSVRSISSLKSLTPTPTSLYRPDSLGTLTPNQKVLMDFILDFQSRIYCSYRKEFPAIEPAFHTTDTGWGCMHRTGQSLLAQGFLWVLLGRGTYNSGLLCSLYFFKNIEYGLLIALFLFVL